jgi:hypothetical protein
MQGVRLNLLWSTQLMKQGPKQWWSEQPLLNKVVVFMSGAFLGKAAVRLSFSQPPH